jgi:8-oxo-dGTP pyrophosphatase MutT (NUDIX family)
MDTIQDLNITTIAAQLSVYSPLVREPGQRGHAAVAMLIKEGTPSPEVLFIIRAEHDRDPWSGNIGFPGGRLNETNESPQQAAIRETFEELSVDLRPARYLGRLDDLFGASMPVLVSCFVYHVTEPLTLNPNHEVASTFWTPLATLLDSERHQKRSFYFHGRKQRLPVVELLEPQQPLLWGITYRLIRSFFDVCAIDFGLSDAGEP